MHDVGKIAIPDAILGKPGKLTAEEFRESCRRTRSGRRVASGNRFRRLAGRQRPIGIAYDIACAIIMSGGTETVIPTA